MTMWSVCLCSSYSKGSQDYHDDYGWAGRFWPESTNVIDAATVLSRYVMVYFFDFVGWLFI